MEPREIHERVMEYALRGIKLYQYLRKQKDDVAWTLGKQYLRSATSIGANLAEAHGGESRADFVHKCAIAQKEARESKYWLKLMLRAKIVSEKRLQPLLRETEEILAIVTTIIVNTKSKNT